MLFRSVSQSRYSAYSRVASCSHDGLYRASTRLHWITNRYCTSNMRKEWDSIEPHTLNSGGSTPPSATIRSREHLREILSALLLCNCDRYGYSWNLGVTKETLMSTDLTIFSNPMFGNVSVKDEDGNIWFVGKEIATVLGYSNTRDALSRHVDVEDKVVVNHDTPSGVQKMTMINESGMYSLVIKSKLDKAKKFKRWVTSEVLPSIRKTGGYNGDQPEVLKRVIHIEERLAALVS